MRICYIAYKRMDTLSGGLTHIVGMLNALANTHDVTCIIPTPQSDTGLSKRIRLVELRPRLGAVGFLNKKRALAYIAHTADFGFRACLCFYSLHRKQSFDILQVREIEGGIMAFIVAKALGITRVYEINGFSHVELPLYGELSEKSGFIAFIRKMEMKMVRLASSCVVVSEQLKRAIDPLARAHLVKNGVDPSFLPSLPCPASQRPILCYAGNIRPWQRVEPLLDALSLLDKESFDHLSIATRHSHIKAIKAHLKRLGLRDKVKLYADLPYDQMPEYLHKSNILIAPFSNIPRNIHFGFSSIKLNEYLATGRVVVSTRLPSVMDLNIPDIILAEPDEPESLATAIREAIRQAGDQASLNRIYMRAQDYVARNSWHCVASRLEKIYLEHSCQHRTPTVSQK